RVGLVEPERDGGWRLQRDGLAGGAAVRVLQGDGVGAGREPGEGARRLERAADRVAERAAAAAAAGGDAAVGALRAQGVGLIDLEAQPRRILQRDVLAGGAAVRILYGDGVGAGRESGEGARRLEGAADRVAERTAAAAAAGGDAAVPRSARRVGLVEPERERGRRLQRDVLAGGAAVGILQGDGVGAGREPGEGARRLERAADRVAEDRTSVV